MNDNILWLNKLVPKHILLDDSEVDGKLEPLNVTREQLPRILLKDPALKALDEEAKPGDVVKVSSLPDPTPDKKIKIKSNKNDPWSQIVEFLKIADDSTATYNGEALQVNGENLSVASLKNVQMS